MNQDKKDALYPEYVQMTAPAAPAVKEVPANLDKLTRYEPSAIAGMGEAVADMEADASGDYVLLADVRALLAAPAVTVSPAPRVDADNLGAKLHDTMDAQVWATEFCRLNNASDHGMMLAWFANAIMVGWDFANRAHLARQAQPTDRDSILEEAALACEELHHNWKWDDEPDSDSGPRSCAAAIRALKGKSGEGAADE